MQADNPAIMSEVLQCLDCDTVWPYLIEVQLYHDILPLSEKNKGGKKGNEIPISYCHSACQTSNTYNTVKIV